MIIHNPIMINIFIYVDHPLNLALTCRSWSVIAKDPCAKTEWLIVHYGKVHALFHAVILGPTFFDIPVYQNLIAIKIILPIQSLLMQLHFGKYDQKLLELKIEHTVGQLDVDKICAFQQRIKFIYLLDEVYKQLASSTNENLSSKGNDMELFHFLSAGPHVMNYASVMLEKYLKDIQDLILNKQFTPLPPKPQALKSFDFFFLQRECSLRQQCLLPNRPLTVIAFFINNIGARPNQRRRQNRIYRRHQPSARRRQLNARRQQIYQRYQPNARRRARRQQTYRRRQPNAPINVPINNDDILNRITNLPQQIINNPLVNQFFNGFSLI